MPVVPAEEMQRLERAAAPDMDGLWTLMRRAGEGAAAHGAIRAAGRDVLVLAGPGNNGGDGYVMAAAMRGYGLPVRVAAFAGPATDLCRRARDLWQGPVGKLDEAKPAPVLVDALFGTGLSRPVGSAVMAPLQRLAAAAELVLALDLPSGVGTDDGALMPNAATCDETYAFGWLKPGHLLQPGAGHAGRLTRIDIGLQQPETMLVRNGPPAPFSSSETAHKYERGHVLVAAGAMPGAAYLAARAAQRGGAGFVTIAGRGEGAPPSSLVYRPLNAVPAEKVDALVVGPGLGRGEEARQIAAAALALGRPLVIDGDMFALFAGQPERFCDLDAVLTPHEGEFSLMFGQLDGSKVARARMAAERAGSVVVLKGRDTVIAAPDGRAAINDHAHPRLAVAGSGDVLAGLIAAERARGRGAFEAACAGVWRHGDAGLRGRGGLIAEDLLDLI